MRKNRTIPFGYSMMCGRIVIEPVEAKAVIKIFSEYINGMSLLNIARLMESGNVRYNPNSCRWNKSMVKRIIENHRYIGDMGFPEIITAETFEKANSQKVVRCTLISNIPEDISEIRERTHCAECGHRLIRKGGNGRYERWDCSNKDCQQLDYHLTDNELKNTVVLALNTVITKPTIIKANSKSSVYTPTIDVLRKEKEIFRMEDSMHSDNERIKENLFELAQMKFDCCTYNEYHSKAEILVSLLAKREQLNSFDVDLFKACVSRIWVSHFLTVEIELVNGIRIKNTLERSDDNESCRKRNGNTAKTAADGKP